jgi:hypothetical protein
MDSATFQSRYKTSPQAVQAQLTARAWKDDAFKGRLVRSPKAAIKEECGIDLPADFSIRVLEMTPTYMPFVIPSATPAFKAKSVDEISRELAAAAGDLPAEAKPIVEKQTRLLARAWKEPAFRTELVKDPRKVLERELGAALPAGTKVEAFQDDDEVGHFILTANPSANGGELSDQQLEAVAGGISPTTVFLIVTILATAMAGAGATGYVLGNSTNVSGEPPAISW